MWTWGRLEVGWGFAALAILSLLAGAGTVLPVVLLSALCHELGHLGALRLAGARVTRLRLNAFGAEIQADTRRLSYPKEILCTAAGPAVNLLLALVFARAWGSYVAAGANLLLGCFNLIPVPALDGGRILHLLVSWWIDPIAADRVCRWVGLGCAWALTAAALAATVRLHAGLFLLLGALGTLLPQLELTNPHQRAGKKFRPPFQRRRSPEAEPLAAPRRARNSPKSRAVK